ncbi:MAG: ATP-binding protein, partial [Gemmatimonadota bacterium]
SPHHESDLATYQDAHRFGLARFLATGAGPVLNRRIEVSARRADGTDFPVELAISPFRLADAWAFTATIRDISARKAAERRLAAQSAVPRILSEVTGMADAAPRVLQALCVNLGWSVGQFWQIDQAGRLWVTAAWQVPESNLTGFVGVSRSTTLRTDEGLPGEVWSSRRPQWISDVTVAPGFTGVQSAEFGGLRAAFGFPILLGEEVLGVMEFFHHQIREPDEPLLDLVAAVGGQLSQFIERRRAEEALSRSEALLRQSHKMEAIGQLAGGVAHDFNNLLTIISGYSDILLEDLAEKDPAFHPLMEIHRAGQRAASLTGQLLAFSRKQVVAPVVVDLNDIVQEAGKMLSRLIGEDVELRTPLDPRIGPVRVDPGQIHQVIVNLAVNARDAMPEGGRLTIETRTAELDVSFADRRPDDWAGRYVLLIVTDTGPGMDEDSKARIFEPFYTTKGVGKGTGLGLAVVHGVIEQSGGHITVDSEPGKGTCFRIYLPEVDGAPQPSHPRSREVRGLAASETILLVEDEEAVRRFVRRRLEASGYTVLEASNGREALRVAERHAGTIHLLISDVIMPEMGGRVLAEQLGSTRPDLRVLFVSGYTDDAVLRAGVMQASRAFLPKPFTPAGLVQKVREVLDQ